MISIPEQLKSQKFILTGTSKGEKIPQELSWQDKNNYHFDNPILQRHLKKDGTYGILTGYNNLVVVDFDSEQAMKEVLQGGLLPATFSVKTAGKGLLHLYFFADKPESWKILDHDKNTIADIQGTRKQVIGPGSKLKNGRAYEVVNDLPIAQVSIALLHKVLDIYSPELVEKKIEESRPQRKAEGSDVADIKSRVKVKDILEEFGINTHKNPTECPMHSSNGGKCLSFKEDIWKCFHCDKGGDIFSLYQAVKGCDFKTALKEIKAKSYSTQLHPTPPYSTQLHPTQPNKDIGGIGRDALINSLLEQERKPVKQLKCGLHEGVYYFGTTTPKNQDCIITSDKRLLINWGYQKQTQERVDEIKNDFGLNYRYPFEFDVLDGHFSFKSLKPWLEGHNKPLTLKEAYQRIKVINEAHMFYPDPLAHDYVALDIISTYFLPIFEAKGRTLLVSEKGSGKTRQCNIYKLLAFNTIMSSDISASSFFRVMESTCGTLIIDDFDALNEEQKMSVIQHYRSGYKNVSKAVRTGDKGLNKDRKQDAFRTYGHVVLNNTEGIDNISLDRSIQLPLIKTDKESITKKDISESSPVWQDLRDSLFILALGSWREIQDAYNNANSSLKGRGFEISRPVLTLAGMISTSLKTDLETWLKDIFADTQSIDKENDWTYLAVAYIRDHLEDSDKFAVKEVAEYVAKKSMDEHDKEFKKKVHGITIWMGKQIKNIPLLQIVALHGANHIKVKNKEKFNVWLDAKGWSRVEMGGVRWSQVALPEGSPQNPESVVSAIIKEHPDDNAFIVYKNLKKEVVERLISTGFIFENPSGTFRLIETLA